MTLLAIDAGNSRIKWGLHDGSRWLDRGAVATIDVDRLHEQLSALSVPRRAIVANVAGDRVARHITAALALLKVQPQWVVSRNEQCGVRSSYAQPERLGPDRWAALIAARQLHDGACVVANAGTTMTVDALSAEGIFLGGFIVPGYTLMREALARNAAMLELRDGAFSFFPDNTDDAISSGALNALAGAIERMSGYLAETAASDPAVILSGGDAPVLASLLSVPPRVVDNIVLDGLIYIGADVG